MSLGQVYDEFEPTTEWASEEGLDTLLVFLPGFKREEIKVQLTSARNLRIIGERRISENHRSRFRKEFPISSNHDPYRLSARFDNGILYINHPKMIVPAEPQSKDEEAKPKLTTETQKPSEPKPEPQRAERGERNKEVKESPKALESTGRPKPQQPEKTDQKKETTESPKPSEPKPESQAQKADKKKEQDRIPPKTSAEKQPVEKTSGKEMTGYGIGSRGRKVESHQKKIGDIILKLKKCANIINLVVAGLFVLVLALYIKNAIISRETTQSGI